MIRLHVKSDRAGESLGWLAQPIVGQDRRGRLTLRARLWRTAFFALGLFWGVALWALLG